MNTKFVLFAVICLQALLGTFAFKNLSTLFVNNVHRLCFRIGQQQQGNNQIRAGCMSCLQSQLRDTYAGCLGGQTVLPDTTTPEQARCLIEACARQIPGQVSLIAQPTIRRRRSVRFNVKQKA